MREHSWASTCTPARAQRVFAGVVLATLLGAGGLSGCVPIAGTLDVRAPVKLNVTETFEGEDGCALDYFDADCGRYKTHKQTVLNTGRYQAALDMSDRAALTLSLTERNKAQREIRFSLPHNLRLPEKEGRFTLLEQELGQPVDVRGNVSTQSTHSNLQREYEFCSYEIERWVCAGRYHGARPDEKARAYRASMQYAEPQHLTLNGPNRHAHKSQRGHGRSCGWRTFRVQGSRQVEFFMQYETRTVLLDLLRPGTKEQVAQFKGTQTETHKHYQRMGACF